MEPIMNEFTMTITAGERQCLLDLLEVTLKNLRVEEHRTRAPSFREHVIEREAAVESLLKKLQQPGN
jgi:hypothetical protein